MDVIAINVVLNATASMVLISGWCLGIRVSSDKGNVLAPLRDAALRWCDTKRTKRLQLLHALLAKAVKAKDLSQTSILQKQIQKTENLNWREYLAKPLITCVTCMASIHGLCLHLLLVLGRDVSRDYLISCALSIPMAAFLNTVLWLHYKRLKNG